MTPGLAANAALAIVTAQLLGVADDNIHSGLAAWQPAPAARGELLRHGDKVFSGGLLQRQPHLPWLMRWPDSPCARRRSCRACIY